MNAHVHHTLTRRWAEQCGYAPADAEQVALWDAATDRLFPGGKRVFLGYHFANRGAEELAEAFLARAIDDKDLRYLGVALHCVQDAVSHGRLSRFLHWPGIDVWARRSPRVRERLERRTKEVLRAYADGLRPAGEHDPRELPQLPLEPPYAAS
ncbi:MAG: hypothetical protein IBX62_05710 [Coriobacteriia bacterium]|nr:hypothetical protein [Coriobacteriia bacterium]